MSTIDLTGMTWQEKVSALYKERKNQEYVKTLRGLYAYRAGSYRTPHEAIECSAHVRIEEPYYGGSFDDLGRMRDIMGLGFEFARLLGDTYDLGFFFAWDGKIWVDDKDTAQGYPVMDSEEFKKALDKQYGGQANGS